MNEEAKTGIIKWERLLSDDPKPYEESKEIIVLRSVCQSIFLNYFLMKRA